MSSQLRYYCTPYRFFLRNASFPTDRGISSCCLSWNFAANIHVPGDMAVGPGYHSNPLPGAASSAATAATAAPAAATAAMPACIGPATATAAPAAATATAAAAFPARPRLVDR